MAHHGHGHGHEHAHPDWSALAAEIEAEGLTLAPYVLQALDVIGERVAAPGVTEYQKVMDTMVLVQQAGVPRVSLMSQPGGNAR